MIRSDGIYERFTPLESLPGDRGGLVPLRERRFHVIGQAEGLHARTALSVGEDPDRGRKGAVLTCGVSPDSCPEKKPDTQARLEIDAMAI